MTTPLRLRVRLEVPIRDVRAALVDDRALRIWLAEYAEVDLPGTYCFWGRYTPGGDVPRQHPLLVDDHTVRLSWLLDGEDTTVEITLTEEAQQSTVLALSQTHVPDWEDVVDEAGLLSVLGTFWALAISNLVDYLTGRELTPMCDFSAPEQREQVVVGAPPGQVFNSLVSPESFRLWFGANMEIEPYVGGRWAMGGFDVENSVATIAELEPDRRLVLDWGPSVTSWELDDSNGKTRLTFVHSGFDIDNPPRAGWMGWLAGVGELRRFHELPAWRSIWLQHDMPGIPDGIRSAEASA